MNKCRKPMMNTDISIQGMRAKKINMLCSFSYVPDHNTDLQVTARCTLLPILDFCPSATTLVDFFLNV